MVFLEIQVNNQIYLVDSGTIKELIHYQKPEFLAGTSKYIEGIISHKKKIIPIISLRKILDFKSYKDTQIEFLHDVEEQHLSWIKDFEHSLLTGEKFQKTLDPHQCELGKWINATLQCLKCNNHGYIDILKKEVIDQHKALHLNGADCLQNKDLSTQDKMKKIEANANETIQGLNYLRDNIDKLTAAFEQTIIFEINGVEVGIIVDNIEKNHHLEEKRFFTSRENLSPNSDYVQFIDHYRLNNKIMFTIKFTNEFSKIIEEFRVKS